MKKIYDFEEIRPFYDEEVPAVVEQLVTDSLFERAIRYALPQVPYEAFVQQMLTVRSKSDFQKKMAVPFLEGLAKRTTNELKMGGLENINPKKGYTFITNHRDIVLDASFINLLLLQNNYTSSEVAIGDNLLIHPWIENLVRINKSFIVKRDVSVRKMLEVSMRLSAYIHFAIKIKNQPVWIAQREGRSKDSKDQTQESLLKMLNLGGHEDVPTNLAGLRIAPITLSYEYDPCDYLKAREFQLKRDDADFKKSDKDDLTNMEVGMLGYKGRVHFEITPPLTNEIAAVDKSLDKATQFTQIAAIIDKAIHSHYRIYSGNYVAYDMLYGGERFAGEYTPQEREVFETYLAKQLARIDDVPNRDEDFLKTKILEMYSNPLKNKLIALGE